MRPPSVAVDQSRQSVLATHLAHRVTLRHFHPPPHVEDPVKRGSLAMICSAVNRFRTVGFCFFCAASDVVFQRHEWIESSVDYGV